MTRQEDSNGYQLPAHANPLLPASREADGQGREPVHGSSGLPAHRWLSYLSRDQTSRKPVLSRRHRRLDIGRVLAGSAGVRCTSIIPMGVYWKFTINQRSTTCVVPPVAAAAERPPGADAACTSTPSCPGSPPSSDAPAARSSGPCGVSRGAKAEAPGEPPANSCDANSRSALHHRRGCASVREVPGNRPGHWWASSSLMRSASDSGTTVSASRKAPRAARVPTRLRASTFSPAPVRYQGRK